MRKRLLSNARFRRVPGPMKYTAVANRLRKARTEPRPHLWFDAYRLALHTHGEGYDKPLIADHELAEHMAGSCPTGPAVNDEYGRHLASVVCFLAGVMLALVAVRAVAPAPAICTPPNIAAMAPGGAP